MKVGLLKKFRLPSGENGNSRLPRCLWNDFLQWEIASGTLNFARMSCLREIRGNTRLRERSIIMNFYSPESNARCHSIGHKMRIARIKIRVDSPGRYERAYGGNAILKKCVLSLERNIGREDEFRVSGGSEFQRRGPMTEKALLPSDDRTYGMERTSESEDRVETECDGNERLL